MGCRSSSVRAALALSSTALAVLAAAGCGGAVEDRAEAAQAVADEALPGELTVIEAVSVPPGDAGAVVFFAVGDDPDARVRVEFRGDAPAAGEVVEAAAEARAQAADLRALLAAFEGCGYPATAVLGLDALAHGAVQAQVWTTGPLTAGDVDAAAAALPGCADAWLRGRPGGAALVRSLSVNITDPAELEEELPEPDPELPTIARLADPAVVAALREPEHLNAFVPFDSGGSPAGFAVRPVLYPDRQLAVDRAVAESVSAWLASRGETHTLGRPLQALSRFEAGGTDRVRVYQVVCPELPEGRRCTDFRASGLVAATVDLRTGRIGGHTVVGDARQGGFWRVPVER